MLSEISHLAMSSLPKKSTDNIPLSLLLLIVDWITRQYVLEAGADFSYYLLDNEGGQDKYIPPAVFPRI